VFSGNLAAPNKTFHKLFLNWQEHCIADCEDNLHRSLGSAVTTVWCTLCWLVEMS